MQSEAGRPGSRGEAPLDAAAMQEKAAATFKNFDKDNKNSLDHEGMMAALTELGVLNGITAKKLSDILSFGSDGNAQKRSYNASEFISFYERLASYQAKQARTERIKASSKMPEVPAGSEQDEIMQKVFLNYCKYTVGQGRSTYDEADPKMSSTQFVKLCQDLGLVQPNGPLNVVTVDVVFHKCKPTGGRRFGMKEFLQALVAAAEDSKINVFERVSVLGGQLKPNKVFVAPQAVVFRQETRAYTPMMMPASGLDGTAPPPASVTSIFSKDDMGDYAAGGMRDRAYQKRSGAMEGNGDDGYGYGGGGGDMGHAPAPLPPRPPNSVRGNSLDDLAMRLEAVEKIEAELQMAVQGINHTVSKEVARGLKETASAVVKESVSSQLGAMVKKMLVEGDMTAQIQASITQSMASMIAGVMEKLKGLEMREEAVVQRLSVVEARGPGSGPAGKAAPAKKLTPEEASKAAAQRDADENAMTRPSGSTGLSRLDEIEELVKDFTPKVTTAVSHTQGMRADFDSRTSSLEKQVKQLLTELEDMKQNNRKLTFQLEGMTATAAEAAAAAAAAAASAATSGPDSPFFQFNQKQVHFEHKMAHLEMSIAKNAALSASIAPAEALDALEGALNNNLDLLHKTLHDKILELEASRKTMETKLENMNQMDSSRLLETKLIPALEQKVSAVNSQIKVIQEEAKAKSSELERRIAAGDRAQQDLAHLIKSIQIGQEALGVTSRKEPEPASNDTAAAKDLIQKMQGVLEEMSTFKQDYQSAMMLIKGDFLHLEARVNVVETDKDMSRLSSYAPLVEVRELENHIMARVGLQGDEMTALARTVNDVISDISTINNKLTENTWQTRAGAAGGAVTPDVVKDIERQLQAHLNTVYQDMLGQLEARWATNDALKSSQDQSRANDEAILKAIKELDKRFYEKVDLQNEALLKIAKQMDSLQKYVKEGERPAANSYGMPMSANPMMPGGFRALSSNMSMGGGNLMHMAASLQSASGGMMPQGHILPYLAEDPGEQAPPPPPMQFPPQMPAFQMNLVSAAPPPPAP